MVQVVDKFVEGDAEGDAEEEGERRQGVRLAALVARVLDCLLRLSSGIVCSSVGVWECSAPTLSEEEELAWHATPICWLLPLPLESSTRGEGEGPTRLGMLAS